MFFIRKANSEDYADIADIHFKNRYQNGQKT